MRPSNSAVEEVGKQAANGWTAAYFPANPPTRAISVLDELALLLQGLVQIQHHIRHDRLLLQKAADQSAVPSTIAILRRRSDGNIRRCADS
jgi:hypothetical protein